MSLKQNAQNWVKMIVDRTNDMEAVAAILNHPRVFPYITDEGSPDLYRPDENHLYIMNEDQTGVVTIERLNAICCIAHIAAAPPLWGDAINFVLASLDWGFKNTLYTKVVAMVPRFNRLTVRLCKQCGFKPEGRLNKSYLKNWQYYDQLIYGMTKTDFYKGG